MAFDDLARYNKNLRIALTQDETRRIVTMLKGLSLHQIRNIMHQVILDDGMLGVRDLKTIADYKKKVFDREGFLEYHGVVRADEIAGFGNLKRWLAERSQSFSGQERGMPSPKGLLLMGVQGCGKSLAVKVIADMLRLPLYQLDIGRLYSQYIGQTEQNLRKALATAEKLSPMCLWIDEIEKGFAASDGQVDGGYPSASWVSS
ncbi:MAG: AAA family ATPase [Bacteroidota bacterium]